MASIRTLQDMSREITYSDQHGVGKTWDKYSKDPPVQKSKPIPPTQPNNSYKGSRKSGHTVNYKANGVILPPEYASDFLGGKRHTKRKRSNPKKLKRKSYRKYNVRKTRK